MRTIEEQTGWKRPRSQTVCQESKVLLGIEDYNFDLDDPEFIKYVVDRIGQGFGSEEKPELAKWILTSTEAEEFLMKSKDFCYLNGRMVPLSDREFHVESLKRSKGKLQDCWELFKQVYEEN